MGQQTDRNRDRNKMKETDSERQTDRVRETGRQTDTIQLHMSTGLASI